MTRTRLTDVACSIARATDLFGDAWTALIMRDVLVGVNRFDDIVEDLEISRKVLAARLARLVDEGILVRERYQEGTSREHYRATDKGKELYPVLLALMNWGDRWYAGPQGPPVRIQHRVCGQHTAAVPTCEHCGDPLTADNTIAMPGPGGRIGRGTRVLGPLIAARGGAAGATSPEPSATRGAALPDPVPGART